MSAIIKNIPVSSVHSSVVLGINTGKKLPSSNNIYNNYSAAASKKWVRQSSEKRFTMDWDMNKSELEFE
ncbi:hypothetical protein FC093_14520 [Ilyomonas limi]|uniref:Uncharacterized protein n=1 Tax=Ilyomonas limi TaxID=2575867 RepID=A0A4U3L011_9BACT|nr:hypothetical protein [Ilyomonas limi]TKK67499.1 hypothetical protein FC093_14520 [Ilyomonas limi]